MHLCSTYVFDSSVWGHWFSLPYCLLLCSCGSFGSALPSLLALQNHQRHIRSDTWWQGFGSQCAIMARFSKQSIQQGVLYDIQSCPAVERKRGLPSCPACRQQELKQRGDRREGKEYRFENHLPLRNIVGVDHYCVYIHITYTLHLLLNMWKPSWVQDRAEMPVQYIALHSHPMELLMASCAFWMPSLKALMSGLILSPRW